MPKKVITNTIGNKNQPTKDRLQNKLQKLHEKKANAEQGATLAQSHSVSTTKMKKNSANTQTNKPPVLYAQFATKKDALSAAQTESQIYGNHMTLLDYAVQTLQHHDEKEKREALKILHELGDKYKVQDAYAVLITCYKQGSYGCPIDQEKAFECYKKCVELGDLDAEYNVADSYLKGIGVAKDLKKGIEILESLVNRNYVRAARYLEVIYKKGMFGCPKDNTKALNYYSKLEDKNAYAKFKIGEILLYGKGVPVNLALGLQKLNQAAELGCPFALFTLGYVYSTGSPILPEQRDLKKAFLFFEKASKLETNDEEQLKPILSATRTLAYCYKNGIGTNQDKTRAFKLIESLKDVESEILLASYYFHGIGVKKDSHKAYAIIQNVLQKDKGKDLAAAKVLLEKIYNEGQAVKQDVVQGYKLLIEASNADNLNAVLTLAERIGMGSGDEHVTYRVGRNENEAFQAAFQLLQKALMIEKHDMLEYTEENSRIYVLLAEFYLQGIGTEKDLKKAEECAEEALQRGNVSAANILGICNLCKESADPSQQRTYHYFTIAANIGCPAGKNNQAWCLLHGIGVKKDELTAVKMLQELSREGLHQATKNLAWCYLNGSGVSSDIHYALTLFKSTSKDVAAMGCFHKRDYKVKIVQNKYLAYNLAFCVMQGYGVPINKEYAFAQYESLSSELVEARIKIAECYLYGDGVEKNENKALSMLMAEEEIYPQMKIALAKIFMRGNGSKIKPNSIKAVSYLKQVIELQDKHPKEAALACRILATCYENGLGHIVANPKEAVALYKQSATLGDREAQLYLGQCYQKGQLGLDIDYKAAFKYFELAAKQGSVLAQHELADCFANGLGVQQDYEMAIDGYQKLKNQNYAPAINNLASLYEEILHKTNPEDLKMRSEKFTITKQQVRKLYTLAAKLGDLTAKLNLLRCYEQEIGGKRNPAHEKQLIAELESSGISTEFRTQLTTNAENLANEFGMVEIAHNRASETAIDEKEGSKSYLPLRQAHKANNQKTHAKEFILSARVVCHNRS